MIFKNIAEYEENDSQLAKHTILDLHQTAKDKDKVVNDLLKRISNLEFDVESKEKENERLNNIVNQVEKLAESEYEKYKDKSDVSLNCVALANLKILNKLKELKGSDKE